MADTAKFYMIRAKQHCINYRLDEAIIDYAKAAQLEPLNYEPLWYLQQILSIRNRGNDRRIVYECLKKLVKLVPGDGIGFHKGVLLESYYHLIYTYTDFSSEEERFFYLKQAIHFIKLNITFVKKGNYDFDNGIKRLRNTFNVLKTQRRNDESCKELEEFFKQNTKIDYDKYIFRFFIFTMTIIGSSLIKRYFEKPDRSFQLLEEILSHFDFNSQKGYEVYRSFLESEKHNLEKLFRGV
ncbi:MAG: hypothetical protein J0H68_01570 [Sphingobacteriia bacterium]|nr:hypothetical protein [Sphingobacteriia bacterium]